MEQINGGAVTGEGFGSSKRTRLELTSLFCSQGSNVGNNNGVSRFVYATTANGIRVRWGFVDKQYLAVAMVHSSL